MLAMREVRTVLIVVMNLIISSLMDGWEHFKDSFRGLNIKLNIVVLSRSHFGPSLSFA